MEYYKVFYWLPDGKPDYMIFKANSKEDAIKKSDKDPRIIYDVWELDAYIKYCNDRRGMYKTK